MNDTYINNIMKKYEFYVGYIPPTKTTQDYYTEVKILEREIQLAKQKIEKLIKK